MLGGGPAGLAAARDLAAAGVTVTVVERAPWVGGLSLTTEQQGYRFDLGGHRWFTSRSWLDRWFRELMEGELVQVRRISRIYFDRHFFHYPIKVTNVLDEAGLLKTVHAVGAYALDQARAHLRPQPVENIEQAYVQQFGSVLYEMFFRRYTEKVWGRECAQLSADWVTQRTKGLSVWEAARNVFVKSETRVESLVDDFVYPRLGYQRISERLREGVERHGGRVLLSTKVVGVEPRPDGVAVRCRAGSGEEREIVADHAISTIPLGELVRILGPAAPSEVVDAAKGLEFRSLITANLLLDRESVSDDTWLYVHDSDIGFARLHEPRNWSPAMAPPGKTSICAEWFCSIGDATWALDDAEIVKRTFDHLVRDLGFLDGSDLIGGFALRARNAYPVYTLDYASRVEMLKGHVERYADRLSIAGRGGTFRYNNADHSIEMGLLVARNLLGESHDVERVNTAPAYQEERIVER